jgi:low temperature requirement protein LtrA
MATHHPSDVGFVVHEPENISLESSPSSSSSTSNHNQDEKNNNNNAASDGHASDSHKDSGDDDSGRFIEARLPLLKSPIDHIKELQRKDSIPPDMSDFEHLGWRYGRNQNVPEFVKHSGSTTYEMFFDLWFVACMSMFAETHTTTDSHKLWTYMGYLTILWVTWFLIGLFDVRFVTDSLFERLTRSAHLGIMVGFSIVGTKFDPNKQEAFAFQGLSVILMISRLVLAVQYGTIVWHIRKYRHGAMAVAGIAVLHFVMAMVYLGITFRFEDGKNSRVFLAWYVLGILEALVNIFLGLYSKALSFNGTHLTERMTVLTLIIIGEGVMGVAKMVVLIVQNDGWTSATIGVLISGIATSYLFFMIYFDWMNYHVLSNARQLFWCILHFPFHVALLLFMDGAASFIVFWKIVSAQRPEASDQWNEGTWCRLTPPTARTRNVDDPNIQHRH